MGTGPLAGVKVIELAGLGPGPFCAMVLSDLGADVTRVDRANAVTASATTARPSLDVITRGRRSIGLDLKHADGIATLLRLVDGADVLIEGFRPGIAERLGFGPDVCLSRNPRLIYGRMTGRGQVVDAAMVDGSALLMTIFYGLQAMGVWTDERGDNPIDTGAHFYDVYETSDGRWVSVGAVEPQFYAVVLERLGLAGEELPWQLDRSQWEAMKERFAAVFRTKTRDEWCEVFDGAEACFAPVLTMKKATEHPHNQARGTFVDVAGTVQPATAPRFSRTPGAVAGPPAHAGQHTAEILAEAGLSPEEIANLKASGGVA